MIKKCLFNFISISEIINLKWFSFNFSKKYIIKYKLLY